jgi:predicted Zn-dependent peptidase
MKILHQLEDQRADECVHVAQAANGMTIALSQKPGFSTSAAYIGLRFGSTDTSFETADGVRVDVPDGSAHFLEHKLFEGREEKVFDRFGKLGANFNGGTGFRSTSYYFVTSDRFNEGLEVLLDFVQDPLITEERVDKEKGIIEQEVRMYQDEPGYRGLFLLHHALYHQHPIRVTPGGAVSEVHRTTASDLQACYDAFYRPHNMVLSLAGDFDLDQMLETVDGLLLPANPGDARKIYPQEQTAPASDWMEEEFHVSRPHIWIGWRDAQGVGLGEPMLNRWLLSSLALDLVLDHSSTYHEELYQRKIVDDSLSCHFSGDADWGYACVQGLSDKPEEFVQGVRDAVARFCDDGPKDEDFERVRSASWGSVISGIQTPAALAGSVMNAMLQQYSPFAILDALQEITLQQVADRARELFDPAQSSVAIIRPQA